MKRVLYFSSVLALALASAACSGGVAAQNDNGASQTAAGVTKAPIAPQVKATHVRLIADALAEVPLRPEQRTEIEQMAKDAETRHASARAAHGEIVVALAAQVEAGKIDRAALQPKMDAAHAALDAARPADRAALERLHAILTPEQRKDFTTALRAQGQAMHAKMGEHGGHGHMQEWATELKLTDDQKTQIHDMLKAEFKAHHEHGDHADKDHGDKGHGDKDHDAMREHHEHGKAMLESFESDHFVMNEGPSSADMQAKGREMGGKMLDMIEKVLPILTPEQRQLAATKLRAKAASGDLGPMGE